MEDSLVDETASVFGLGASDQRRLVRLGVAAGAAAIVMYLARTFLPLPEALGTAFFVLFGPSLVVAFVGFYPFLARPQPTISALLGTTLG
jgi:hypothetical protein